MGAFMGQKGCLVVCGEPAIRSETPYTRRLSSAGRLPTGADCIEKEMRPEHVEQVRDLLALAGIEDVGTGRFPPVRVGAPPVQLPRRQPGRVLMASSAGAGSMNGGRQPGLYESATFDRNVIAEIQRAAREGMYDIRGFGAASGRFPISDDCCSSGVGVAVPARGVSRESAPPDVADGMRYAREPVRLDIPITIAGTSFGASSGPAGPLARGAATAGISTVTRGRRDDTGGVLSTPPSWCTSCCRRATA